MDYSRYEIYDFDHTSVFNMSTGYKEGSYQMYWHSYGEILLVWPMGMHAIVDADREKALVIQL